MAEPNQEPAPRSARSTFGPVVLLGLAGSGLGAVAGHRDMLAVPADFLTTAGLVGFGGEGATVVEFPLAGALALVALACWGVLLVTRGVVRRVLAVVAALAAAGILAVVLVGGFVQDEEAADDLSTRLGLGGSTVPLEHTTWFWACLAAGLLALVAAGLAVRLVGSWPEMGTRYDAPTAGGTEPVVAREDASNLDLWKSMDEGRDPTAD